MTFYRTDIPKMALAALVAAIIVFMVLYVPGPPPPTTTDRRISWDEAKALMDEYDRNPLICYAQGVQGSDGQVVPKGFKLNARNINEVINNNQNGEKGNKIADELMIYFGAQQMPDGTSKLQLIAVGVEKAVGQPYGVIMKNPVGSDRQKSSVFDRADPCPPNCPIIK